MFPEPSNTDLLANCKRQALTQNRLQSHSPVGSMNLGWAATEGGELKEAHDWSVEPKLVAPDRPPLPSPPPHHATTASPPHRPIALTLGMRRA